MWSKFWPSTNQAANYPGKVQPSDGTTRVENVVPPWSFLPEVSLFLVYDAETFFLLRRRENDKWPVTKLIGSFRWQDLGQETRDFSGIALYLQRVSQRRSTYRLSE